jgi:hypothetical protein
VNNLELLVSEVARAERRAWWRDTFRLWAAALIAGAVFALVMRVSR